MKFDTQSTEQAARTRPIPLQDWTSLDCLTHDFLNCASYRQHCLAEYGQYMRADGVRVTAGAP